jgi:Fic family protein
MVNGSTWPELVLAYEADPAVLSRAVTRGTLRRVARGIYTGNPTIDPAAVVRKHLWRIVAHELPGAVIADRSVRAGGMPDQGMLYVVHQRRRPYRLPGVTISTRAGAGPVAGDMALPDGLWMSSTERALLDNLKRTGERHLSRAEVEEWIERLLQQRGEDGLNALRDNARVIAGDLDRTAELRVLEGLIGTALATRQDVVLQSSALRARAQGSPYDERRLRGFATLVRELREQPPDIVADLPEHRNRRHLLPFYEAYFSNYIEGTEFTVDEAASIVFSGTVPEGRPQDAHDVLGTYEIVRDTTEMATVPRSGTGLLELLRARHAVLMGGRPEKNPGRFKTRANRAGLTEFVPPDLVEGTLLRGFDLAEGLASPFERAVYLMFLVAEVHPFDDGNGRIARIMMNAELVAGGEVRIIIPIVYRANYLSALKNATHNGVHGALIKMLSFARRYTARIDFSRRETAEADLSRTNAFHDALDAEAAGIRLTLP